MMNYRARSKTSSSPAPVVEGFAVQFVQPVGRREAVRLLRGVLGPGWTLRPFGDEGRDFEMVSRQVRLAPGAAWNIAYGLRALAGVAYAEPMFAAPVRWAAPTDTARDEVTLEEDLGCSGGTHLPESDDPEWPLREVAAFDAWREFSLDPDRAGEGVVIAVTDTGYRPHPEIVSNLLLDRMYDFEDDDRDALDPLDDGLFDNPGHGTGTTSIIISPRGAQDYYLSGKGVSGIAPGAKAIPLRVTKSVVLGLFSTWHLANAIEYAANRGAHVISISLGTVIPSFRLSRAVGYAKRRGVIMIAAAGNCTPFVVIPAAYGDVVAVAASNARREIWAGSSRGSQVDVTAPGESVWRAEVDAQHPSLFNVQRGKGTSFSAPIVAGIAALWLARHGRENLVRGYGADKIPALFNQLLRASCTVVPGWDTSRFGKGLANARQLLAAPLPARVESNAAATAAEQSRDVTDVAETASESNTPNVMDEFVRLFENALPRVAPTVEGEAVRESTSERLAHPLAVLLGVSEAQLPMLLDEVGPELAFHLAVSPALHTRFAAALAARPSGEQSLLETQNIEAAVSIAREALAEQDVSGVLRARLR